MSQSSHEDEKRNRKMWNTESFWCHSDNTKDDTPVECYGSVNKLKLFLKQEAKQKTLIAQFFSEEGTHVTCIAQIMR